jgi:hypothetical protein
VTHPRCGSRYRSGTTAVDGVFISDHMRFHDGEVSTG